MRTIRIKIPTLDQVSFSVSAEVEYSRIEGNASAIDPETDEAIVKEIKEQLDNGNEWAWCSVCVTGKYKGIKAESWLGCCSYANKEEFMKSDYCVDMKLECYADIVKQIENLK